MKDHFQILLRNTEPSCFSLTKLGAFLLAVKKGSSSCFPLRNGVTVLQPGKKQMISFISFAFEKEEPSDSRWGIEEPSCSLLNKREALFLGNRRALSDFFYEMRRWRTTLRSGRRIIGELSFLPLRNKESLLLAAKVG